MRNTDYVYPPGTKVLWRKKGDPTFTKGYIIDQLLNCLCINPRKHQEAVCYWDINGLDIKEIKE